MQHQITVVRSNTQSAINKSDNFWMNKRKCKIYRCLNQLGIIFKHVQRRECS